MYKPTGHQKIALDNLKRIDPNCVIRWDERVGVPLRIKGNLSRPIQGDPEIVALQFIETNKNLFSIDNTSKEVQLKDIGVDPHGNRHVRLQQKFKDYPVFGRELVVHIDSNNVVKGVNGKFHPKIELPQEPEYSSDKAKEIILKHDRNNKMWPDEAPKLMVLVHENKPYLVWHMTVEGIDKALDGSKTPAKWEYFVDSMTGEVIWRYNNEQTHSKTTGTGNGKYAGNVTVNTVHDHTSTNYQLIDQWLPTTAEVNTHDANNGYPPADVSEDNNNSWTATDQGPEVDCHLYTRMVYDYFLMVHGRNSYDNAGADMHIYAHIGTNWNNASWNGSYVKIGDGDGTDYDPLCALDIIAHEWTHAVTENTAGLIYNGESGALNESISDVFASLIDGDWLFGEDAWLKSTAPASRNLADPTNGGQYDTSDPINSVLDGHQPDHMDDKYTGWSDNGGVHINSGIMNKAAYLIATGGVHRGITICEGLGREVLGRLYYQALTNHLISSSDFSDMKEAVLDSLEDLYLGDPRYNRWRSSIINAFAAVGIGSSVTCLTVCWIAPTTCPPSPHIICPPSPMIACPPSPIITCPPAPYIACPPAPTIRCPPSPMIACPPSPGFICPPAPRGCLPGPDPIPFTPQIKVRPITPVKELDIIKIAGIGEEYAKLMRSNDIDTVEKLIRVTETDRAITDLAKVLSISEQKIRTWRNMAKLLVGEK